MSGHSKWSTIKRKKAKTDLRRGKLFSKLVKEITVAARMGGGDPAGNARLRTALFEARSSSVPGENIDRAVKKGTGELESEVYEEFTYEGYGPAGVAVLVDLMTDNRNRTAQDVRKIFQLHGGNLGENGCVGWMFARRGYFAIEQGVLDEDAFLELALELGADDAMIEEDGYEIFTTMETYLTIREELERRGIPLAAKELAMIPQTYLDVEPGKRKQVERLIEALEDHDDVQNVWTNLNLDEDDDSSS